MCASLIRSRSAAAAAASSARVLTPSVSAGRRATCAATALARARRGADRVGEVELALGVLRLEPVERRPERVGAEDVDRRVRPRRSRARSGVASRRLDDRARPRRRRRARCGRSCGASAGSNESTVAAAPLARDARDELLEQLGRQERRVAGEDEHVAGEALERAARAARTASPVPSGVLLDGDRARRSNASAAVGRGDDDERVGAERPRPPRAPSRPSAGRAAGGGASATAERIRVPRPAAMTTAASRVGSVTGGQMAGAPGFEPGITGPKPAALPLGYAPSECRASRRTSDATGRSLQEEDERDDGEEHDGDQRSVPTTMRERSARARRAPARPRAIHDSSRHGLATRPAGPGDVEPTSDDARRGSTTTSGITSTTTRMPSTTAIQSAIRSRCSRSQRARARAAVLDHRGRLDHARQPYHAGTVDPGAPRRSASAARAPRPAAGRRKSP